MVFDRNRLLVLWYGCDRLQLLGPNSPINFDAFCESRTISLTACLRKIDNNKIKNQEEGILTKLIFSHYLVNVACGELLSPVFDETTDKFSVFVSFFACLCFDFNFLYKVRAMHCCCSDLDLITSDISLRDCLLIFRVFYVDRTRYCKMKSTSLTFAMPNGISCQTNRV